MADETSSQAIEVAPEIVTAMTSLILERVALRHQLKAITAFGVATACTIYGVNQIVLAVTARA